MTSAGRSPGTAPAPEITLPASRSIAQVLRFALHYVRNHVGSATANIACALLSLGFSFAFPQVTQFVIDDVIDGKRADLLLPAILVLLAAYLLRDLFDALRIRINARFEQNVVLKMRRDLFERLQLLPLSFFNRRASGDLISRIMDDVNAVEKVVIDGSEMGITSLLSLVVVATILVVKDPYLAFFAVIPLPLMAIGIYWYTRRAHRLYRKQRQAGATLNALIADNIQGIRQVKAFGQEQQESRRFWTHAGALRQRMLGVMNLWSLYSPAMNFVASLGVLLVFWVGGPRVLSGEVTLGQLIGFVFYLPLFYEPVSRLHRLNQMIQIARASSERLHEIMGANHEGIANTKAEKLSEPVRGKVRYEDVSFDYGAGRDTLKGISLEAAPGEVTALVGPVGCGKTTLLNLLPAFYRPTRGRIFIDGRDIAEVEIASLRASIGMVTQETFLFDGTIRENLAFAHLDAGEDEIAAACRAANCHEFITGLPDGYDTRVGERGIRLSVGEKQRISIARALLKNAPILILDEATASVDAPTEQLIREALDRLTANRTTFIIAHRMATVRDADKILVMSDGEIIARGRHEELIDTCDLYRRLCGVQSGDALVENQSHFDGA